MTADNDYVARILSDSSLVSKDAVSADDVRRLVARRVNLCQEQIRAAYEEISQLRSLHNSLATVNRLPPELLSHVFSYLHDLPRKNVDLIRATHICKHWRAVALKDPSLWSKFSLHHTKAVKQYLERSKGHLLSLSLIGLEPSRTVNQIRPVINRIRSLHITSSEKDCIQYVFSLLTAVPAPALEELHVKYKNPHDFIRYDIFSHSWSRIKFVKPTFGGNHRLRSLLLHEVPFLFRPPATLVNFEFQATRFSLPSLTTLLDVFGSCPLLETISLSGDCELSEYEGIIHDKVPLPRLLSLTLHTFWKPSDPPQDATSTSAATILSFLLPQNTSIHIHTRDDGPGGLWRILPEYVPAAPVLRGLEGLRRLELSFSLGRISLRADHALEETFQTPALNITTSDVETYPLRNPAFGDWRFSTSHIERLVLANAMRRSSVVPDPIVSPEPWIAALGQLSQLRTLCVVSLIPVETAYLLEALSKTGSDMLCPRLSTLEFIDLDLQHEQCRDRVLELLLVRSSEKEGEGLERVEMANCGLDLTDSLKETLGRRGVELDWGED
ncbi:hypothetical protein C8Q80DRAFT_1168093 [Daedaleopsis nitida]|nr:hypothetical protein C8Q80DRAFT_1168093 [Daedaleopsis nitida]